MMPVFSGHKKVLDRSRQCVTKPKNVIRKEGYVGTGSFWGFLGKIPPGQVR